MKNQVKKREVNVGLNKRRLDRSQKASSFSSGGFFRFKNGRNKIRVFSFKHKVVDLDFKKGFYKKGEAKIGEKFDEIDREVLRHFTEEGVINCLLTDCKYCDESNQYLESSKKSDKKIGTQLSARRAFYVNMIDIDNQEAGIQLGCITSSVYNVILSYVTDPEFGEDILGYNGRDFVVDFDKNLDPSKMYTVKIRDAERCEELSEDLQDTVTDLFRCEALEAGWSSNENLSESEGTGEDDQDKVDRKKSAKKDDEDLQDDESTEEDGGKLPWEKGEAGIKEGASVEFVDEGETLEGIIDDINTKDEEAAVKVGDEIYDIPIDELTVIEKKKKSRKR